MSLGSIRFDPITAGMGIPAGYLDWRYVVQLATVPSGKVLGTMVLGDPLSGVQWVDVTADTHGVSIECGAAAGARPGAGQMDLWFDNDSGAYDPTLTLFNGPGSIIRVSLGEPGTVCPIFTGIVVSWNEASEGVNAVRRVEVAALQTVTLFGEVNDPAVPATGAGDLGVDRVNNIVNLAAFPFSWGFSVGAIFPITVWTFQATTYAQDLWTELLLTCDSMTLVARAGKNGSLRVTPRSIGFLAVGLRTLGTDIPIIADSIETANDDERIVGAIAVARAGGAAVTYTKNGIQGRYQRRTTQRYDLLTQDPGANADLARYAADVLDAGAQTYRVEALSIETDGDNTPTVWQFISQMDLGTLVNIDKPDSPTTGVTFSNYIVCGYQLGIEPVHASQVHITGTIETDVAGPTTTWSRY